MEGQTLPPASSVTASSRNSARLKLARQLQRCPRRVHDLIRADIRSGMARRDDQLVEHDLVHSLGTSRNAVRRALQLLAQEGLVSRAPRHGTSVVTEILQISVDPHGPFTVAGRPGDDALTIERTDTRRVPATPLLSERLRIDDSEVVLIEDVVRWRGAPMMVRVGYLPVTTLAPTLVQRLQDRSTAFEQRFGVPLGSWEAAMEAMACEASTARLLDVPEGMPILVRELLLRDEQGRARELSYTHYRSDRVALVCSGGGG